MLKTTNCLNCGNEVFQNFCPNCGQKTSVHRYSIQAYLQNDLMSAVTDINKGFLFTVKQLFTKPGQSIREYLEGKRVGYIGSITFILLVIGLSYYLSDFTHIKIADLVPQNSKKLMNELSEFARKNQKSMAYLTVPFYSLFSFLWFRKSKFNLTEHFILNTYITAATFIISTVFTVISIFYTNVSGLKILLWFIQILNPAYMVWSYFGFFEPDNYTKKGLIFRGVMVYISVQILVGIVGVIYGIFRGAIE